MKRYIIILAAVLSALVSCKKHNTDENTSGNDSPSPSGKQWLMVPAEDKGYGYQIFAMDLPGGKCTWASAAYRDYPEATYLVWDFTVNDYQCKRSSEGWDIIMDGKTYYVFSNVTETTATITDTQTEPMSYSATAVEKPLKLAVNPFETVAFGSRNTRTNAAGLALFRELANEKASREAVNIGGPGEAADYQGKDVNGKIAIIEITEFDPGKDPGFEAKRAIAAEKGAIALLLIFKSDMPFMTLEYYNALPTDSEGIPIALWSNGGDGTINSGTYTISFHD